MKILKLYTLNYFISDVKFDTKFDTKFNILNFIRYLIDAL